MNDKQINVGIIGVGDVTINRHIPSVKSLNDPNGVILALADILPGRAKSIAEKNGIPIAVEDYRTLLEMDEINAISINTPVYNHKQLAIEALEAGKHVYLEKPVTMNEQEMKNILEVARKSGKILLAGSNGLLQRQMLIFKSMIDKKELGEVYLISVERASDRHNDYIEARGKRAESGISLHSASHNIEWALYFLGDPKPISVIARGYYKYGNISHPGKRDDEEDDCCIAIIQFDNGASFIYKAMRSAPASVCYNLKIHGDMGTLEYDVDKCYKKKSDDCIRIIKDSGEFGLQTITPLIKCGYTHEDMYRHFFECIRQNKQSMSNGERAVVVMKVMDAIAKSIQDNGKQKYID